MSVLNQTTTETATMSTIKTDSTSEFILICAGLVREGICFKAWSNEKENGNMTRHYKYEIELTGGF